MDFEGGNAGWNWIEWVVKWGRGVRGRARVGHGLGWLRMVLVSFGFSNLKNS